MQELKLDYLKELLDSEEEIHSLRGRFSMRMNISHEGCSHLFQWESPTEDTEVAEYSISPRGVSLCEVVDAAQSYL